MLEATDLRVSAGVRRELSVRRIDLAKLKFAVKNGIVSIEGDLNFVGIEKSNEETAIELKFLESSLNAINGVKEVKFALNNWGKNEAGIWESTAEKSSSHEIPISGEGLVCQNCNHVIRFCPCCGKPLASKTALSKIRKPLPPIKPIIKKKPPISSTAVPLKPATSITSETDQTSKSEISPIKPAVKVASAKPIEQADSKLQTAPQTEATKSVLIKPESPAKQAKPMVSSTPETPVKQTISPKIKPEAPAPTKLTDTNAEPAFNQPKLTKAPEKTVSSTISATPAKSESPTVSTTQLKPVTSVASTATAKPATPAASTPVSETASVIQPPVEPISKNIDDQPTQLGKIIPDLPDFEDFDGGSLDISQPLPDNSQPPSAKPDQSISENEIPDLEQLDISAFTAPVQTPAAAPSSMPAPNPTQPLSTAPTSSTELPKVPDLGIDLPSDLDVQLSYRPAALDERCDFPAQPQSDMGTPPMQATTTIDNPSDFDDDDTLLPPLKPNAPSQTDPLNLNNDTPLPPLKSATPPRTDQFDFNDNTPLPPLKPAAPSQTDPFDLSDDTPLPPLKPNAKTQIKDPFAALFNDSGNDSANDSASQKTSNKSKDPFAALDLDLDILEVFPSNDTPAASPAAPSKADTAAQTKQADNNPLNLDNFIDLDAPVEDNNKKGQKDPFDLDDFDISKFKI